MKLIEAIAKHPKCTIKTVKGIKYRNFDGVYYEKMNTNFRGNKYWVLRQTISLEELNEIVSTIC